MPTNIQSLVNMANPLVGVSRSDIQIGDILTFNSIGAASTWSWFLAYKPQNVDQTDSSAVLAGVLTSPGPITLVPDFEGSYLVGLITDQGLPTESRQFVRMRVLTKFGKLTLVAANERRDSSLNPPAIPVDASSVGWANDQNYNINKMLSLIEPTAASGRIIFVDANRGRLNSTTPDTTTTGYADFSTISDAINAALTNPDYNGGVPPTIDSPIIVAVRPGLYDENITFAPFVHVIGWPSTGAVLGETTDGDRSVTVRNALAGLTTHVVNMPLATDYSIVRGLTFLCTKATTNAVFRKLGAGSSYFEDCRITQTNNSLTQGECLSVEEGYVGLSHCIIQQGNLNPDRTALSINPAVLNSAALIASDCVIYGPSVASMNTNLSSLVTVQFDLCSLRQIGPNVASYGLRGTPSVLVVEDTEIVLENGNPFSVEINPAALGHPADVFVGLYKSRLGEPNLLGTRSGISFDATAIVGQKILEIGASDYSTISTVGPVVGRSVVQSQSLFYDNTSTGLTSTNVQGALDEITGISRTRSFSQPITVPTVGVPPLTFSVFTLIPETFTSVSVDAWMATAFAGTIATDVTLDVLVRPSVTAPGVFASVIGGPNDIGTLTSTAINIPATDLTPKTGPSVVEFRVVYNVIPAAGDGFLVNFRVN